MQSESRFVLDFNLVSIQTGKYLPVDDGRFGVSTPPGRMPDGALCFDPQEMEDVRDFFQHCFDPQEMEDVRDFLQASCATPRGAPRPISHEVFKAHRLVNHREGGREGRACSTVACAQERVQHTLYLCVCMFGRERWSRERGGRERGRKRQEAPLARSPPRPPIHQAVCGGGDQVGFHK